MGSDSSTAVSGTGHGARSREQRREAILTAAFTVFARRGYAQTCVQEVAREAGVAKPTVYNHLDDKEALYREAVQAAAGRVAEQGLAAVERLRGVAGGQVGEALTAIGQALAELWLGPEATALRELACAHAESFPGLSADVRERTAVRLQRALSDHLARLALAGHLRPCDPDRAAEHLLALLTGPAQFRSYGAGSGDGDEDARQAVDVFLRAYGA
ncbi:TetR/AcrR family transcriptional regulator [Streptomyces sp. NRRL WC-3742]|uniref:TetR/AcrR family transcriptional regulator n=1 Tax=Streptomyces sp. NRRL WC-3742 TaxID=1463934 RepID=UPI0004C8BB05|nr:TetR/AcrR family transcriptional regulator [Streptomyces sp. NRRL WC-3742]